MKRYTLKTALAVPTAFVLAASLLFLIAGQALAEEQTNPNQLPSSQLAVQNKAATTHNTDKKALPAEAKTQPQQAETTPANQKPVGTWKRNATGWWYEFNDGTYLKNGIFTINNTQYCFYNSGYMVTGWVRVGGKWYHFAPSGSMTKGWVFSSRSGTTWALTV